METKILKIKQIKLDDKLYPRFKWNYFTKAKYYNALKSGAVFPPIIVAKLGFKYILVDGQHRLEAYKDVGETHIECEVLTGLTREQIFEEAVKRNVIHGRQFSTQEVVRIVATLKNFGYNKIKISQLVCIPAKQLKQFVADRITGITDTDEKVPLKAPLKNLAGIDLEEKPNQSIFSNTSQVQLLDSVISLLKNEWIDLNSGLVRGKLKTIYRLLIPYFIKKEDSKEKNKEKSRKTKK